MKNDQSIWKYNPSSLYREKQYSIFRQVGHQSLKQLLPQEIQIKKKRHNLSLQNSFEKLPEIEKTRKKFIYEVPKLEYPSLPLKILTVEEYRIILEKRIKEEEQRKNQKQKWELPKIEVFVKPSKYSIKSSVDNQKLRIKMEQFLID
ncbi:unnamed protein product [Paramecium sonneborni]|uniref:Uncharacterized protein n=1 Tax=Paramecium sonneborni TaxID=65129 RepID=A0A8S1QJP4_9CILI|nr:unnamed protein product [Paramecium sonneborni]